MAVSKRLRFEILRRDNHACTYCGATAPGVKLTVDHVHPVALGGTDDPENLTTACEPCNTGKGSVPAGSPLVAQVATDALRWSRAMKIAAEEAARERESMDSVLKAFSDAWLRFRQDGEKIPAPADWYVTVEDVWRAGLDVDVIVRNVDIAMSRRGLDPESRWRYWCGCCWRQVDRLQARAREIVTGEA